MQPGIHRITDCLVRVTPYVHNTRDAVVVFFGTLSNLPDLVARRREFRGARTSSGSPPAGASGTWLSSSPPGHVSGGASHGSEATGTGAQTTSCLLDMYKHFADGRELLLLSELQGQYAFVLYDSSKKTAFAARDPSGVERLYYKVEDDGGVSYTNSLDTLPAGEAGGARGDGRGSGERGRWQELPPGHYMVGKHVAQFALTLQQLETREKKESLDADALHMLLRREVEEEGEEEGALGAVRSLIRRGSK